MSNNKRSLLNAFLVWCSFYHSEPPNNTFLTLLRVFFLYCSSVQSNFLIPSKLIEENKTSFCPGWGKKKQGKLLKGKVIYIWRTSDREIKKWIQASIYSILFYSNDREIHLKKSKNYKELNFCQNFSHLSAKIQIWKSWDCWEIIIREILQNPK